MILYSVTVFMFGPCAHWCHHIVYILVTCLAVNFNTQLHVFSMQVVKLNHMNSKLKSLNLKLHFNLHYPMDNHLHENRC